MVKALPSDVELKSMSPRQLEELAARLETAAERERLSDALLRINQAWQSSAHSETSDTRRRRRIRNREIQTGEHTDALQAQATQQAVNRILLSAARAGLTASQRRVWFLADVMGWTQETIAGKLNVKQPSVSRCLGRARRAMWEYIDEHSPAFRVFQAESHGKGYFEPAKRPDLPPALDGARRRFEELPGISTHIIEFDHHWVEIWIGEEAIEMPEAFKRARFGLTYSGMVKAARNPKKVLDQM